MAAGPPRLLALCYHDVVASPAEAARDPMAVTVDALVSHLAWLDAEGYEAITLDAWQAAAHGSPLPDKAVLLTFDDGYASFSEHVLPLLELFGFSAVLAPVTAWVDAPPGSTVHYGDSQAPRDRFMTWDGLRAAAESGRVEIASHSHDLHRGVIGNPQGNSQPAAVTRRYTAAGYEDDAAYRDRVRADLAQSAELIERHVGVRPRTVVWPYGAYNADISHIAATLGMTRSLTLAELPNSPQQRAVHRYLMGADSTLQGLAMMARGDFNRRTIRAAHVDLDYVFDADGTQQRANLDQLLDRIKALRINRVFLQAFADPDGDGVADALYFPNRHLPVRADLFNRVAWQLRTRAGVEVYAWMPVLAFELPDAARNALLSVQSADGSHTERYHRLSPFHPEARRLIHEIYDDLGRLSRFRGVLFHDDAFLTDREDVSPAALDYYARYLGMTVSVADGAVTLAGDVDASTFARAKTRALIELTEDLATVLRRHHPELETARNLYARVVMEPASEAWFAQNLRLFLDRYDYTALMAMPYLEEVRAPEQWLAELTRRVASHPAGLARTVFEVQTVDWRYNRNLAPQRLARQLDVLLDGGARHLAWYPDDFVQAHPTLRLLRSRLSLSDHPAELE